MSHRKCVLVGSIPSPDAESAMTTALALVGAHLRSLPDGETGARSEWVANAIDSLKDHPDLVLKRDGGWMSYEDRPEFAVRRGHTLTGESLDLGYLTAYRESRPVFDALATSHDFTFQVGIASPFDMAMFALGPRGALTNRRPFVEATSRDIVAIQAESGGDVLFQIELPAELVFVARTPRLFQARVAAWMARITTEVVELAPAGSRFGVHLCLGDLGHKALALAKDATPVVTLANAIASRWPTGKTLEYVHAPLAAGEEPPSTDPGFYAPLAKLRLPSATPFAAGFVHEGRTPAELVQILGMIEAAAPNSVDVAAACGLGRRDPQTAEKIMRLSAELCEA